MGEASVRRRGTGSPERRVSRAQVANLCYVISAT